MVLCFISWVARWLICLCVLCHALSNGYKLTVTLPVDGTRFLKLFRSGKTQQQDEDSDSKASSPAGASPVPRKAVQGPPPPGLQKRSSDTSAGPFNTRFSADRPEHVEVGFRLMVYLREEGFRPERPIPLSNEIGARLDVNPVLVDRAILDLVASNQLVQKNAKNYVTEKFVAWGSGAPPIYTFCNYPEVMTGIKHVAALHGAEVVEMPWGKTQRDVASLGRLNPANCKGAIICPYFLQDNAGARIEDLHKSGITVVNAFVEVGAKNYVGPDHYMEINESLKYLRVQGHREFAFLTYNFNHPLLQKIDGYWRRICLDRGMHKAAQRIIRGSTLYGGDISVAFHRLTREYPEVTAAICLDDLYAYKMIRLARMKKLNVPDDLSVMSISSLSEQTEEAEMPLTTLEVDMERIGRIAATLCIKQMYERLLYDRAPEGERVLIKPSFLSRDSTAPPAQRAKPFGRDVPSM